MGELVLAVNNLDIDSELDQEENQKFFQAPYYEQSEYYTEKVALKIHLNVVGERSGGLRIYVAPVLLYISKNNIDEISHTIKLDESAIEKEVNKNPVAVDHREMPSHSKEKEAVDAFEKNFNELRAEFKTFAAKWI